MGDGLADEVWISGPQETVIDLLDARLDADPDGEHPRDHRSVGRVLKRDLRAEGAGPGVWDAEAPGIAYDRR